MGTRCARCFVPFLALAASLAAAMLWLGAASVWSALALAAAYALAVLGVGLVAGQSGQLTLGHGALFALGAYAMLGVHGGLSGDEMWIPLIHARRAPHGGGFVHG